MPLEADAVTAELVFHSAHFLGMDQKDLVAEAVRVYLEQRSEEIRHGMVQSMRLLDGALGASVTMVAGQPPAQVEDTAAQGTERGLTEMAPGPAAEAAPQPPPPAGGVETAVMHPGHAVVHPDHHIQDAQAAYPDHIVQDAQFHQG